MPDDRGGDPGGVPPAQDPPAPDAGGELHVPPGGDELPEDLDVTAYVGTYAFPDISRRRWIGGIHLAVAAGGFAAWAVTGAVAWVVAGGVLGATGLYHVLAGWPLRVSEEDALVVASRAVGFPVGHASAQLTWRGLRSRPTWRIVLYSADEPPTKRGLVELDAVDGAVLGDFTEDNPEDWSELT